MVTSCLEAARYPAGSVRKVLAVSETAIAAAADEDEEFEFEGIFSVFGSLFGSMWPSMSPQARQVEPWMRRRERIILHMKFAEVFRMISQCAEHRIAHPDFWQVGSFSNKCTGKWKLKFPTNELSSLLPNCETIGTIGGPELNSAID